MRVLELITFLGGGGAERFVVDLSNQLANFHDTFLITILDDKKDSEGRTFYREEIANNVHYINLGIPNGLKISSQWKVYTALKKLNPDVIHVHMIPTLKYMALAAGLFCLKNKVFFSVHSDLHNGYDKGLLKFFCNTFGRMHRFKLSCLSKKNYDDFKAFYPHTPVQCIMNGRAPIVATDMYDSVKSEMGSYRRTPSSILLIHIARYHPVKNQLLLIQAVNSLIMDGYNIDLVVVGAGFDSQESKAITTIACNRIHFIGVRRNIADYLLNADIFCLSSDYEGMPITLLEACLAGVPAVSTPTCGAVDIINNGKNGYLSNTHCLEDYKIALINSIQNFSTIKSNAMDMRENSPYTIAECAKKYVAYFSEV